MNFNPYIFTFATFLVPITSISFGIFVLIQNSRSKINITFFLLSLAIAFWGLFLFLLCFLGFYEINIYVANILDALLHFFALLIPAFFLHLVLCLINKDEEHKGFIASMYFGVLVTALLSFSPLMLRAAGPKYGFGFWVMPGVLYPLHLIIFSLLIAYGYYILIVNYMHSYGDKRNQLLYFILATSIGYIGGANNYLLNFNINLYPFSSYANLLVQVYIVLMSYAIVKYKLMDINIIIRRGLMYSVLVGIVTGLYVAFLTFSNQYILRGNIQLPVSFLPFSTLLTGFIILSMGIFVFLKDKTSKTNRVFGLFCLSVFTWLFMFSLMYLSPDSKTALFWARLGDIGIIFLPIWAYYFIIVILNRDRKPFSTIFVVFCLLAAPILVLSQTKYLLSGIKHFFWGYYPIAGPLYWIPISFFILFIACIPILLSALKEESKAGHQLKVQQIKYLMVAYIGAVTGLVDYFPKYNIAIYPWGHLSALIFISVIAYAILKHQLMDIEVVLRKGLIYSLLVGLLTALYLSGVFLFGNYLGSRKSAASILFTIFSIIFFSLTFQPLRDKIQEFIDKVFFRGKYDYQKTLKELSLVARSIAGLDELLDKVLNAIVSVIKLNNASIYVLDKRGGQYFARRSIGIGIKRSLPENDDIIKQLASRKEAVMYDEVSKASGNISGFMKEIGAAIIFPIITKDEIVGFLCLGEKLSGEVYSDEDIDLLTTLCNQMGVSIENAMLYEDALEAQKKLYQADKLATVGALAAGLAHEIKNPIAAIKGFSQLIDRAVTENDAETIKDFKDVVPRQLDRINEIVEKLLTLSKPPKLEKKKVDINALLVEIVRLVEKQALKQRVEIVKSFEDLSQTLADPEQLTQAFLNLILNAIQSMPDGGQIEIRTRFMGTDRIVVEIIDNGMGIPKEKRLKIFDPFYTTKTGGSGLGLSVTQKIIIDHHGKIEVESEVGKGSAFKIVLPIT